MSRGAQRVGRRRRRVPAFGVAVGALAVALGGLSALPASAGGSGCGLTCAGGGGDATYTGTASSVTVTVTGGPAGPGASTSTVVQGPPPTCWWSPLTGKVSVLEPDDAAATQYPEKVGKPGQYWGVHVTPDLGDPLNRDPADAAVADACIGAGGGGLLWLVEGEEQPPPPPWVAIDVLLDISKRYLTPPEPTVDRNPAAAAVVNLPTWVWTDDASRQPMTVRAQSGPNWVEITADPQGLDLSAPYGRQEGSCASGGTAWGAGATTDCTLVFTRSSAGRASWPMSVSVTWTASWTSNRTGPQGLAPTTAAAVVNVPVAEVQALVRR